jgi:hypothetical protein
MNVLRKEEPLSTADIAGRQRAAGSWNDATLDQNEGREDDRRPPRSAAVGNTAGRQDRKPVTDVDGIHDAEIQGGEIVASSPDSTLRSGPASDAADQRATYVSQKRPNGEIPFSKTAPSSGEAASSAVQSAAGENKSTSGAQLFVDDELRNFRARWDQVQTSFVDEPRHAVEQADTLVAAVVQRIAEQFAEERAKLEQQWDHDGDVSTEELRQGLKRYRAFFDRLLSF